MKVSDIVAKFIYEQGIKHVFGITGGYIIHVWDSLSKYKDIELIFTNHEQGASMAADAYSRINRIGCAISTSGPGAMNLMNGVACAYFDSIPMLVITGQSPLSSLKRNEGTRQRGFQEVRVKDIYKSITNYTVQIDNPEDILYELEKSIYLATHGRCGPVVIDIPDDIQRAEVDELKLKHFLIPKETNHYVDNYEYLERMIRSANKPIVILGAAVRNNTSWNVYAIRQLLKRMNIPVILTWGAIDILPHNDKLFAGTVGVIGTKYGNKALLESDFIISIGTRLDEHLITTNTSGFATHTNKVVVDIDTNELQKLNRSGLKSAKFINASVDEILNYLTMIDYSREYKEWIKKINKWKKQYPICKSWYYDERDYVNPYVFMQKLSEYTSDDDIIITDAGANLSYTMQGYPVKGNQRLFSDLNNSSMGYSLPASIGACFANDKKRIICIIGDGGFQMNIQELAVIRKYNLPIKIFIFNNKGYGMIQQTQDDWLDSKYIGSSEEDLCLPDNLQIAEAYELLTSSIVDNPDLWTIPVILETEDPVVCDVNLSPEQRIHPKLLIGKRLDEI